MAGITIDIRSNVSDLLARLRAASASVRRELEEALAEQAIAYAQDLRGSGPGVGITPFDTGRLLMGMNLVQRGLGLVAENLTEYAEWARKAGRAVGGYDRDSGAAFRVRFGAELLARWEGITTRALEGRR